MICLHKMTKIKQYKKNNTLKINLLVISLVCWISNGFAQDTLSSRFDIPDFEKIIVTDRPDRTESPKITPHGFFQVESGAQSEYDYNRETGTRSERSLLNTTLWKYGVTKNFELRLITEYANSKFKFRVNNEINDTVVSLSGFNPISIGSKIALQKEHGIVPNISLITQLELPYFGSSNYKPNYIIPRFRFLFSHTLTHKLTFSYNLGAEWENESRASTGIYTASLGIALFKNLNMFVESYGFFRENSKADNRLDGGLTYLLNNDIQLDCSGGFGLNEVSPDYFVSGGISFRFNAFNKELRKAKLNFN